MRVSRNESDPRGHGRDQIGQLTSRKTNAVMPDGQNAQLRGPLGLFVRSLHCGP
jgi:hypothetical protein